MHVICELPAAHAIAYNCRCYSAYLVFDGSEKLVWDFCEVEGARTRQAGEQQCSKQAPAHHADCNLLPSLTLIVLISCMTQMIERTLRAKCERCGWCNRLRLCCSRAAAVDNAGSIGCLGTVERRKETEET